MTVEIETSYQKFITTEPLGEGLRGERKVWDSVREAYRDADCIGFWRYPIFSKVGEARKEPDILLAHRELGLVVIEVKGIQVNQIEGIHGHQWHVQGFNRPLHPYQQAESQLHALLSNIDREPCLWRKVIGRSIVALPFIQEREWQTRGFDRLPAAPPIIFSGQLSPATLRQQIQGATLAVPGSRLDDEQWQMLLAVIGGRPIFRKPERIVAVQGKTRASVISDLRDWIYKFDIQQSHIGFEIPPGPQRIRGIAGSGKTVLLCQKAAQMHIKHPNWEIALVFFTRSLYDVIIGYVDQWLRFLTNGDITFKTAQSKLHVLHTWGARGQPGLYSRLCAHYQIQTLTVGDIDCGSPSEKLATAVGALISQTGALGSEVLQIYDAILIDEGQDLVVKDDLKVAEKQAIYWMAYSALRSTTDKDQTMRRLIWAYDEAQSLDNLKIPSAKELFGEDMKHIVQGSYPGGIKKSEIMHRCYRTPGPILAAAHALGMGLLRSEGMLTGLTNREDWAAIGYEVDGQFKSGHSVTLRRPAKNSPNPVHSLWPHPLIEFHTYGSRAEELYVLAENLRRNLAGDGLKPSREVLVIVLGQRNLETYVAAELQKQGIQIYIPSALRSGQLWPKWPYNNPNLFWYDGAVTVSGLHRAKGNEAEMVYVVCMDEVSSNEDNIHLRNQLFVAMTRSRAWVSLSGVGESPFYEEVRQVLASGDTFKFTFHRPPRRDISDG